MFRVEVTFNIEVASPRVFRVGTYALKMGTEKFPSYVGKYLTTLQDFKSQRQ